MTSHRIVLSFIVPIACLAAPAPAQTLYGVQGPNAHVVEISGPPASGVCGYPDGPIKSEFGFAQTPACAGVPAPVAFFPAGSVPRGDVTVDRARDVVYVTDGTAIAGYDANGGVLLENFTAAAAGVTPPLTGLGWDGEHGWLWLCNANGYAALEPDGSCTPIPRVPFIPRPLGVGFLTDIDRDVHTGELWVCDADGAVSHFMAGSPLAAGTSVVAGAPAFCGGALQAPLTGLAVDASTISSSFFVTDGATIVRLKLDTGVVVQGGHTLLLPYECWNAPAGPPLAGLGFAAHCVTFGEGNGLVLKFLGQSTSPSSTFLLVVDGGPPGSLYLLANLGMSCPAKTAVGAPLVVSAFGVDIIGPFPYGGGAAPLVSGLPPPPNLLKGLHVMLQAFVQDAGGAWTSSNGIGCSFSWP